MWAGANNGSFRSAATAVAELAGVVLTEKQVRRLTIDAGAAAVTARDELVRAHFERPLMERLTPPSPAPRPRRVAVLMDGGRYQRRDRFAPRKDHPRFEALREQFLEEGWCAKGDRSPGGRTESHWREERVGLILSLGGGEFQVDPHPEFPVWLVDAPVVRELAKLAARDESDEETEPRHDVADTDDVNTERAESVGETGVERVSVRSARGWPDIAPEVLSREVVASGQDADSFGRLLEYRAWTSGLHAAECGAFVADGLQVNWTIHARHFSHLTGVLDLMHALSYAWRAAAGLSDPAAYRRFARAIWEGRVDAVIEELRGHLERLGPPPEAPPTSDTRQRLAAAVTYYDNHRHLMNYPEYRRLGLPLTSSHVESAVKQISARVKGTEKFWTKPAAEALLQLRADSLSDTRPLDRFWKLHREHQTGANRYRPRT